MRTEEDYTADGGTEITLGIGKLLVLFFGLVILCGISLGVGYTLGRNSMKQALANAASAPVPSQMPVTSSSTKPGAATITPPAPVPVEAAPAAQPEPASPSDLTFSKSLTQKEAPSKLAPVPAPAPKQAAAPPAPRTTLGAGYMVQVAAVRNQDDAKLLSDALQRQRFPVVIVQPGDKLYHVQVGPYADVKDAESIRAKLIAAGYNAFLKR